MKTVRGEHGETWRECTEGPVAEGGEETKKRDHNPFEEVHGDEGKVTKHNPVKCNKKHVNSREKARNRREH